MDRLEHEIEDIAGLRIMCQFVDDIDTVVEIIRVEKDMRSSTKGLRKRS